jgi:antagonist of KipI
VQDLGRAGFRASGVPVGGALDSHALKIANLLVGNETSAAGLEVNLGKVRMQFTDDRLVAWCGGAFDVRIDMAQLSAGRVGLIRSGEELTIVARDPGARGWIALSGGIDVSLVLGSRATDARGGFGGFEGRALRDGDVLELGPQPPRAMRIADKLIEPRTGNWLAPNEWACPAKSHGFLRVVPGAGWSLFDKSVVTTFLNQPYVVSPDSDRMGIRLEGPTLERLEEGDLLSEAVAPGTIQVPPSGQPILLLGDCQTIGGYPKIAHVITVDLPAAVQLRPGDSVRFAEVSLADAQRLLIAREREVDLFKIGLELQAVWS